MKKGFVISWFFPPNNSSEGLVTFKLLKNSEYNYDVFTQNNNGSWTYNTKEDKLISQNVKTILSKADNLSNWVKEGVEYFEKHREEYDFIMSRSMPPESHLMALEIKEKYPEIKWIASFGDPIENNPYEKLCIRKSPYSIKGKSTKEYPLRAIFSPKRILKNALWNYRKRRYDKNTKTEGIDNIESKTINKADKIILNNKYEKEYMLKNYSDEIRKKAMVIPHTYDADFYPKLEKSNNNKIIFSYVGHLDDIRTAMPLLKAINRLKNKEKDIGNKMEFDFYGDMSTKDKIYIMDNELYDIVKVKKSVDYFKSLEIMQNSDWLLLIDANIGEVQASNIFFAAKLADYLGTKNNIIGITMVDGPSADIIRETGGIVCSHSYDEIYMYLKLILDKKISVKMENCEHYDIKQVVKEYDDTVEKLLK